MSAVSERFRNDIRLGRSGLAELWLATDTTLDRPVLIESLPSSVPHLVREGFVEAVRRAAGVHHNHLAAVYAVENTETGAFAVTEWAGGVTVSDRIEAGEPIPVDDFLPNAAGLADGLAALHEAGITHGAIGPETILLSAAHPAKLTGFGRAAGGSPGADTAALAETLVSGLAGGNDDVWPSEVSESISKQVDTAMRAAIQGEIGSAELAARLRAAPSVASAPSRSRWTWGWLSLAAALVGVATGIFLLGFAIEGDSDSPLLFPAGPVRTTAGPAPPTAGITVEPPSGDDLAGLSEIVSISSYDPFGDGTERERDLALAIDGDPATAWRTERYFDPIRLLKPGVGLTFEVAGTARTMSIAGGDGTGLSVGWAPAVPASFEGWQDLTSSSIQGGGASVSIPAKEGGVWLLWLTDLPPHEDNFVGFINEVRFSP